MSDPLVVPTLEYAEEGFYPDEAFLNYNAVRCIQEERKFEILSRYQDLVTNLSNEFMTLVKPEYAKFISETGQIKSLKSMFDGGMTLLNNFTVRSLSEIARRLIFKYSSHDEMTAGDVSHHLFSDPGTRYDEFYDDYWDTLEQGFIQQKNMAAAIRDKQAALRQRPIPHVSGGGVGFSGIVYGAMSATISNIGLGVVQGISDGLEYSSDKSKLKGAEDVRVNRARDDIINMGREQVSCALSFCQEILMSDMQLELEALGIAPYKIYSAQDAERIKLRNENYDEAYREHDIEEVRYIPNVFRAISEDPYDIKQYVNLYLVAIRTEDEAFKSEIMSFAAFLGIEKLLDMEMEQRSAAQISSYKSIPERTVEDVKRKIKFIAPLYGESAKREVSRLNEKLDGFKAIEHAQKAFGRIQKNISAGHRITAYIKPDRTVAVIGADEGGALKVNHFKKITAISSRSELTIGLCSDGTVVSSGSLRNKAKVQDWKDILDISMGGLHCAGVKRDGTVVCAKVSGFNDDFDFGQTDVSAWRDIVSVVCGSYCTVGVKKDGTVVFSGRFGSRGISLPPPPEVLNELAGWTNISAVAVGTDHILGLRKDGTVVSVGSNTSHQCEVQVWNGVVAIAAGYSYSIGLRYDGTVYGTGENNYHQCDVAKWRNIIAVAATADHTVGMTKSASLVAAGSLIERCTHLDGIAACTKN